MSKKNDKLNDNNGVRCSFCGKTQEQEERMIAGPGVYICGGCVELCNEIIEEQVEELAIKDNVRLSQCSRFHRYRMRQPV